MSDDERMLMFRRDVIFSNKTFRKIAKSKTADKETKLLASLVNDLFGSLMDALAEMERNYGGK